MQRSAYSDGCNEQHGWSVCWEMTAHDGILFSEATFEEEPVFASAKIPQVEAWYPSWPGGYRDEIGFSASVPPFGDTQMNDLGNGFEVRQLFTEFTHWPNCVCCYRYEQVMRFYDDGSFEPRFVSHGPGCDDLSVYRPFWRIDINVDGAAGDSALFWNGESWEEAAEEREFYPLVDEVAPGNAKLATVDGERRYVWSMARTDPLGLDEARLFVLRQKAAEGGGPVPAGPGDTFQPPRQWIDGEALPESDLVVWFVPLLKTKKMEPLWCMPDPEPGINQCEAILRVEPVESLPEPSDEDLTIIVPTATATAVPTPAPTATPRPVQGDDAADLILNAGCGACHLIGDLGEAHKVGPELTNIADVAGERVAGLSAAAYLRQSIVKPNAYIVPECPNGPCPANVMPQNYEERLSDDQIEQIVQYLLAGVEVAPTPAPIGEGAARPTGKAVPAAKQILEEEPQTAPAITLQVLLISLVALLTLFRLNKLRHERE
jgi:mono/diheme cytochrome c family protein